MDIFIPNLLPKVVPNVIRELLSIVTPTLLLKRSKGRAAYVRVDESIKITEMTSPEMLRAYGDIVTIFFSGSSGVGPTKTT